MVMKKEVTHAFEDMQEALRDHDGGATIDVDVEGLQTVLRWAERHGLVPDYAEGDRVRVKRSGTRNIECSWLREGDLGEVYSVHDHFLRIVWDTDPKVEPSPYFFSPREIERVYE